MCFVSSYASGYVIMLHEDVLLGVDTQDRRHELLARCVEDHGLTEDQRQHVDVHDVMLAKREPGSDHLDEDPSCVMDIVYHGPGLPHGMTMAIAD